MRRKRRSLYGARELTVGVGLGMLGACHLIAGYDDFAVPEEPSASAAGQGGASSSQGGAASTGTGGGAAGQGGASAGGGGSAPLAPFNCVLQDFEFTEIGWIEGPGQWVDDMHVQAASSVEIYLSYEDVENYRQHRIVYDPKDEDDTVCHGFEATEMHSFKRIGTHQVAMLSSLNRVTETDLTTYLVVSDGQHMFDVVHLAETTVLQASGFQADFAYIEDSGDAGVEALGGDIAVVATQRVTTNAVGYYGRYNGDALSFPSPATEIFDEPYDASSAALQGLFPGPAASYLMLGNTFDGADAVRRWAIPHDFDGDGDPATPMVVTKIAADFGGLLGGLVPAQKPANYMALSLRIAAPPEGIGMGYVTAGEMTSFVLPDLTWFEQISVGYPEQPSLSFGDNYAVVVAPVSNAPQGVSIVIAHPDGRPFTQHAKLELPEGDWKGPMEVVSAAPDFGNSLSDITLHLVTRRTVDSEPTSGAPLSCLPIDAPSGAGGAGGAGGGSGTTSSSSSSGAGGATSWQRLFYGQAYCTLAPN